MRVSAAAVRRHPALAAVCAVALLALVFVSLDGVAVSEMHQLESEMARLPQFPALVVTEKASGHKPGYAFARTVFKTAAPYDQVRAFYDSALESAGWQRSSERALTVWGNDLGGRVLCYSKAEYWAILEYSGSADERPRYTFGLIWGTALCRGSGMTGP
jgi:hypothetical protein